jgi:hypothetical protein
MTEDYQPTTRELYDLILSLKDATELGFARNDRRFDGVDYRLNRLEGRVTSVEGRLTSVEGRLGGLERWGARIDEHLGVIDGRLLKLENR